MTPFKTNLILFVPALIYFFIALYTLPKIGIGWDTSVNLAKGEQVFNFLRTLNPGFLISGFEKSLYFNEVPGLKNGHPPAFSLISFLLGNLFSRIFGFKYYFFHLANIFLATAFLYYLPKYFFYKISKSLLISVTATFILISIPYFFVHSIVNTKDFPVLVFSFFVIMLFLRNFENTLLKLILISQFFLLALFIKFTVIFLLPLYIYLFYKDKILISFLKNNLVKTVGVVALFIYANIFYFWPNIIFTPIYELERLLFVYFHLPANYRNYVPFYYFYYLETPLLYTLLFALGTLAIFLSKNKFKLFYFLWVGASLVYLIFINKQYDTTRQFLFLSIPFVFSIFYFFIYIKGKRKFIFNLLIAVSLIYCFYLITLSPYKKVIFTNAIVSQPLNDGWGLTLPVTLDYVNKNYNTGRIYYSPASFLLEYYNIKKFEIIYDPFYADIFITTTKTSSYVEEQKIRENFFKKDTNFNILNNSVEIWVKKSIKSN